MIPHIVFAPILICIIVMACTSFMPFPSYQDVKRQEQYSDMPSDMALFLVTSFVIVVMLIPLASKEVVLNFLGSWKNMMFLSLYLLFGFGFYARTRFRVTKSLIANKDSDTSVESNLGKLFYYSFCWPLDIFALVVGFLVASIAIMLYKLALWCFE